VLVAHYARNLGGASSAGLLARSACLPCTSPKGQTYRGSCELIFDGRHVNYISELTLDEWLPVAQDLRDSERLLLRVFVPDHINIERLGNTVPHLHWGPFPKYRNDGRWGQPIWTTTRSEMRQEFLADDKYASYVRQLQYVLDAP